MRTLLLFCLLAACRRDPPSGDTVGDTGDSAGVDTAETGDTDTGPDPLPDLDGDGYTAAAGDCDDGDATAFPGAPERCNERDDDCDGDIDELATDATRWYDDDDGDGYGVEIIVACAAPDGAAAAGGDCDDGDPGVYPGAAEVCDGVDQDCDDAVDEDALDAFDTYADADSDGFGDPATGLLACAADAGRVVDASDCDDAAPGVNPGATEICDDAAVDEDCDGLADDADPEGADGGAVGYPDIDGDGYGDAATAALWCVYPANIVADATDCDDGDPATNPGAVEVCGGADEDCDGAVDEDDAAPATWYSDGDADGFGNPAVAVSSCTAPRFYVEDATDCDPANGSIYPGAPETCDDGLDQDCDGDDAVCGG